MIQFKPITDKQLLTNIFEDKTALSPTALAVVAIEEEKTIGSILFSVQKHDCIILEIYAQTNQIADGLLRSALFYAANHGAFIAYYHKSDWLSLFETMHWQKNDDGFSGEISTLLQCSSCHCNLQSTSKKVDTERKSL